MSGGGDDADAARLERLRTDIATLDDDLIGLFAQRLAAVAEIGGIKQRLGLPVLDPAREAEVVRRAAHRARERGVDPELVRAVLWRVIDHARQLQDQ